MNYLATLTSPVMTPFDKLHPHKHFQLCRIHTGRGEIITYENVFVSCPPEGLGANEINSYMIGTLGVHSSMERVSEQDDWFWMCGFESAIKLTILDEAGKEAESCPVYSIDDPEIQTLRRYCPNQFDYSPVDFSAIKDDLFGEML